MTFLDRLRSGDRRAFVWLGVALVAYFGVSIVVWLVVGSETEPADDGPSPPLEARPLSVDLYHDSDSCQELDEIFWALEDAGIHNLGWEWTTNFERLGCDR